MGNIGSRVTDVAVHFSHHTNMLIAVEEGVFLISCAGSPTTMRRFVSLKTGIGQDHDQALAVFIGRWDRDMLLSNKVRKFRRWE